MRVVMKLPSPKTDIAIFCDICLFEDKEETIPIDRTEGSHICSICKRDICTFHLKRYYNMWQLEVAMCSRCSLVGDRYKSHIKGIETVAREDVLSARRDWEEDAIRLKEKDEKVEIPKIYQNLIVGTLNEKD